MYRILLCDDNNYDLNYLKTQTAEILKNNNIAYSIEECSNISQLKVHITNNGFHFDLMLLDIKLDDGNMIDYIKELRDLDITCPVIYCTYYNNFTLDAIESEAFGYLLKPIQPNKLETLLLKDYRRNHISNKTFINLKGVLERLYFKDVVYIETYKRGSNIITTSKTIYVTTPFTSLIEEFPSSWFCRCHYSYVVNKSYISSLIRYKITLSTNHTIPISKSRYNQTKMEFMQYLS